MYEDTFLKTMIDCIRYDEYANKQEMLSILRNSKITFSSASGFGSKSYQRLENIDLRVPVPLLKEAKKYNEVFANLARQIYEETDNMDMKSLLIKPKLVELDVKPMKEHDVYFSEIKDTIIQGIRNAKYLIWAAVAWFTDKDIFQELKIRKMHGIDIKIIISDDQGNKSLIDDLVNNFECIKVPRKGYWGNDIMHDKFCIIDLEYVMHGSYNWSKSAITNEETLATALDKEFVLKFADEFMRLYRENKS